MFVGEKNMNLAIDKIILGISQIAGMAILYESHSTFYLFRPFLEMSQNKNFNTEVMKQREDLKHILHN